MRPPSSVSPVVSTPSRMRAPELAGAPGEPGRHLGGARDAVPGAPYRGDEVVDVERRHDRLRFPGRDHADVDAEAALERDARLEAPEIRGIRDQEEVADPLEAGVAAELLLEGLEHLLPFEREADLGLGAELGPDPAGGLARGAAADRLALQHDHVTDAPPGEVIRDAAADGAAADHDDARGAGEAHRARAARVPSSMASWMRRGETASPTSRSSGTRPSSSWYRRSFALPPKERTTVSASIVASAPENVWRVRRPLRHDRLGRRQRLQHDALAEEPGVQVRADPLVDVLADHEVLRDQRHLAAASGQEIRGRRRRVVAVLVDDDDAPARRHAAQQHVDRGGDVGQLHAREVRHARPSRRWRRRPLRVGVPARRRPWRERRGARRPPPCRPGGRASRRSSRSPRASGPGRPRGSGRPAPRSPRGA